MKNLSEVCRNLKSSNMKPPKEQICFDSGGEKTDSIEDCDNKGCGFNIEGICTASGTECFGYIDPQ